MLFSPRGIFIEKSSRKKGFLVCRICHLNIGKSRFPSISIANGFFFGSPPAELTELTESEMAVLTPVTTFGFCFTMNGGKAMKLCGTLGYYKVRKQSIVRTTLVANTLANCLNRNVVFLLHGDMTKNQKEKAMKKSEICPAKMKTAIEWLVQHNCHWFDLDICKMEDDIDVGRIGK